LAREHLARRVAADIGFQKRLRGAEGGDALHGKAEHRNDATEEAEFRLAEAARPVRRPACDDPGGMLELLILKSPAEVERLRVPVGHPGVAKFYEDRKIELAFRPERTVQDVDIVGEHVEEGAREPAFARYVGMQEVGVADQPLAPPPDMHEGVDLRMNGAMRDAGALHHDAFLVQPFAELNKQITDALAFQSRIDQPRKERLLRAVGPEMYA